MKDKFRLIIVIFVLMNLMLVNICEFVSADQPSETEKSEEQKTNEEQAKTASDATGAGVELSIGIDHSALDVSWDGNKLEVKDKSGQVTGSISASGLSGIGAAGGSININKDGQIEINLPSLDSPMTASGHITGNFNKATGALTLDADKFEFPTGLQSAPTATSIGITQFEFLAGGGLQVTGNIEFKGKQVDHLGNLVDVTFSTTDKVTFNSQIEPVNGVVVNDKVDQKANTLTEIKVSGAHVDLSATIDNKPHSRSVSIPFYSTHIVSIYNLDLVSVEPTKARIAAQTKKDKTVNNFKEALKMANQAYNKATNKQQKDLLAEGIKELKERIEKLEKTPLEEIHMDLATVTAIAGLNVHQFSTQMQLKNMDDLKKENIEIVSNPISLIANNKIEELFSSDIKTSTLEEFIELAKKKGEERLTKQDTHMMTISVKGKNVAEVYDTGIFEYKKDILGNTYLDKNRVPPITDKLVYYTTIDPNKIKAIVLVDPSGFLKNQDFFARQSVVAYKGNPLEIGRITIGPDSIQIEINLEKSFKERSLIGQSKWEEALTQGFLVGAYGTKKEGLSAFTDKLDGLAGLLGKDTITKIKEAINKAFSEMTSKIPSDVERVYGLEIDLTRVKGDPAKKQEAINVNLNILASKTEVRTAWPDKTIRFEIPLNQDVNVDSALLDKAYNIANSIIKTGDLSFVNQVYSKLSQESKK